MRHIGRAGQLDGGNFLAAAFRARRDADRQRFTAVATAKLGSRRIQSALIAVRASVAHRPCSFPVAQGAQSIQQPKQSKRQPSAEPAAQQSRTHPNASISYAFALAGAAPSASSHTSFLPQRYAKSTHSIATRNNAMSTANAGSNVPVTS